MAAVAALALNRFDREGFRCIVRPGHGVVRVQPVGELDLATAAELQAECERVLAAGWKQLVLDLRALSFIDGAGVRLVVGCCQRSPRCAVIAGPPQVQRAFRLTGQDERVSFVDGRPDAEDALGP